VVAVDEQVGAIFDQRMRLAEERRHGARVLQLQLQRFLPGFWAFRRELPPSSPTLPQVAGLEEVPLGVRILP
jgi:hypothetical protein